LSDIYEPPKLAAVASVHSVEVKKTEDYLWRGRSYASLFTGDVKEKWISAFKARVHDKRPNPELDDLAADLERRLRSHLQNLDTSDPQYCALLAEIQQFLGGPERKSEDSI
jgi:transposase